MNQPIRIPETMNAVGIEGGKGPAEALKFVTLPTPKPGVDQILVRVAAAGVNQPDLVQREGRYPLLPGTPETMGLEIADEVVALGERVSHWKVGDSVCALLLGGGYAEYAAVDARHVLPVPQGLTIEQAASLPETVCSQCLEMSSSAAI
jgi:NADPH:quinone reductase